MLNINTEEKDVFVKISEAVEKIFFRFGTTRGLSLVVLLLFFTGLVYMDKQLGALATWLGFVAFLFSLASFHVKPHIDRINDKASATVTTSSSGSAVVVEGK